MPPLPPAPGPARKRKTSGSSSGGKSKSRPKLQAEEPPVMGWSIGFGTGCIISLVAVLWLSWATLNSRDFLPAARALAASDAVRSHELLEPFCNQFQANRFLERPEMIAAPFAVLSSVVVALKDEPQILVTVSSFVASDAQLGADSSVARFARTAEGVTYPLMMPGDRIKYTWLPRMACLVEDWKLVLDTAREGLDATDRFWNRLDGVPIPSTKMVLSSSVTAVGLKYQERQLRVTLIWALAQDGQYSAALNETERLLAEPLAYQDTFSCFRPELLFLRAAIESKLGQSQQALQTYQEAQQAYDTPLLFDYGQPQLSRAPQLPTPSWHYPLRPKNVIESWHGLRANVLGFPQRWFGDKHTPLWSLREHPHDFTDDFLEELKPLASAR